MSDFEELTEKVRELESEVAALKQTAGRVGVRKRSQMKFCGVPLWEIAVGPDTDKNEIRGHARAIIAIGDIATGVFAMGGVARGLLAFGGVALGAITFGGCSIGLLLAMGGFAVGSVAVGGAAVGWVAIGGAAFGYYACGGGAFGEYVISSARQDPEAVRFLGQWIPGIDQ